MTHCLAHGNPSNHPNTPCRGIKPPISSRDNSSARALLPIDALDICHHLMRCEVLRSYLCFIVISVCDLRNTRRRLPNANCTIASIHKQASPAMACRDRPGDQWHECSGQLSVEGERVCSSHFHQNHILRSNIIPRRGCIFIFVILFVRDLYVCRRLRVHQTSASHDAALAPSVYQKGMAHSEITSYLTAQFLRNISKREFFAPSPAWESQVQGSVLPCCQRLLLLRRGYPARSHFYLDSDGNLINNLPAIFFGSCMFPGRHTPCQSVYSFVGSVGMYPSNEL